MVELEFLYHCKMKEEQLSYCSILIKIHQQVPEDLILRQEFHPQSYEKYFQPMNVIHTTFNVSSIITGLYMPRRRIFYDWVLNQTNNNPQFLQNIMQTNEAKFTRQGILKQRSSHVWSHVNPQAIHANNISRFSI